MKKSSKIGLISGGVLAGLAVCLFFGYAWLDESMRRHYPLYGIAQQIEEVIGHSTSTKKIRLRIFEKESCSETTKCLDEQCRQLVNDCLGAPFLSISQAYLTLRENWNGGDTSMIRLEIAYPSMEPFEISKSTKEVNQRVEAKVIADLTRRGAWDIEKRLKRAIATAGLSEQSETKNGMSVFNIHNKPESSIRSEIFIPLVGARSIYFQCTTLTNMPITGGNPVCKSTSDFDRSMQLEYQIPYSDLVNWEQYDTKIRQLIRSFEANNQNINSSTKAKKA